MLDSALFSRHLEDDEHVTLIVHKHWIFGIRALTIPSLSILFSLAFLSTVTAQAAFSIVALWGFASIVLWVRSFFDYYLDAWIVTDHGIIDLEWKGWFHRQAARVLYSDIQGVSYEIKGILGTVLRYGDVSVEKISTGAAISLTHVPHPRAVETKILQNMEVYLHKKNMKDARHVQEILAGMVAGHVQTVGMAKKATAPKVMAETDPEPEMAAASVATKPAAIPRKKKPGFASTKINSRHD